MPAKKQSKRGANLPQARRIKGRNEADASVVQSEPEPNQNAAILSQKILRWTTMTWSSTTLTLSLNLGSRARGAARRARLQRRRVARERCGVSTIRRTASGSAGNGRRTSR